MPINKKDERVRKLWEKGIRDKKTLARKLGYSGNAMIVGIERVEEAIKRMKLK